MYRSVIAFVLLFTAAPVLAQQQYQYSVLVDHPSYPANVIHTLDTRSGAMVPYSNRVKSALSGAVPSTVRAISLSHGLDGIDYVNPHGLLGFSIGDRSNAPNSGGVPGSSVSKEHRFEAHADLYIVPNTIDTATTLNIKTVEENTAVLAPLADQYMATASFSLPGGWTGTPIWTQRPNIIGLDYHLTSAKAAIYFTIDRTISLGGQNYHPNQILMLSGSGALSVWADQIQLGLQAGDVINGLSMCVDPTDTTAQVPNCLFSLAGGSTSLSTSRTAADVLHFKQGDTGYTEWRTAAANGLFSGGGTGDTEIGGIVSIDPKEFLVDSEWVTGEPGFEYDDETGELLLAIPGQFQPVILWNYSLHSLDSNTFNPGLQPGDEGLLAVHYIDGLGNPRAHYDWIEKPGMTNWAADATFTENNGDIDIAITTQAGVTPANAEWIVSDGATIVLTAPLTQASLTVTALDKPRMRDLQLRTRDTFTGNKSLPIREIVWQPSTVPSPTNLSIKKRCDSVVEISYEPGLGATTTTMMLRSADFEQVYSGLDVYSIDLGELTGSAYIEVEVVSEDSLGKFSKPLRGSFFMGIRNDIDPLKKIEFTNMTPGDLAFHDATMQLAVVPPAGTELFQWYLVDLLNHKPAPRTVTPIYTLQNYTGVTSYPVTATSPDGDAEIQQRLLFIGTGSGVDANLYLVDAENPWAAPPGIEIDIPGDGPFTLGALTYEPQSEQILFVVNQRLHSISLSAPLDTLGAGSILVATAVETLREAQVEGVACRANGFYEVTVGTSSVTHLLQLNSDHRVSGSLKLDSAHSGAVKGILHADRPLATTFVSKGNTVYMGRSPHRADPCTDDTYSVVGMPYDFDNDGTAGTPEDWAVWDALKADPVGVYPLLPNHSAFDVAGTSLSYPGNGQLDSNDFNEIFANEYSTTLPSICVPVHPAWVGTEHPCAL